jgi:SAM-dependent methyltransferase
MTRQGKPRPATPENLIEFWELEAVDIGETPDVTIRDRYYRIYELHSLLLAVPSCRRLLDVGCGTGLGTLLLSRRATSTLGVDFSREMIMWAKRLRDDDHYRARVLRDFDPLWGPVTGGNIAGLDFDVANLVELDLAGEPFDVIVGQRILINLPSHEEQMLALERLRAHASPDSLLMLTEATLQGHRRTDDYRGEFGVPALEKYWHNNYVDENRFDDWEGTGWQVVGNLGFATYALLSKVVYPAACGPERCEFLSAANRAAMELASMFRSQQAVDEIGMEAFLGLYVGRVAHYDHALGNEIESWVATHAGRLVDWAHLGHQRLLVARPVASTGSSATAGR